MSGKLKKNERVRVVLHRPICKVSAADGSFSNVEENFFGYVQRTVPMPAGPILLIRDDGGNLFALDCRDVTSGAAELEIHRDDGVYTTLVGATDD